MGEQDTQWRNLANDTKDMLEFQGVEVTVEVLLGQARLMYWIDGALGRWLGRADGKHQRYTEN